MTAAAKARQEIFSGASARAALTALAGEIRMLAAASAKLETHIAMMADGSNNPQRIEELQKADALSQALDNLAAYAEQLSRDAPEDLRIPVGEALGLVRLSDMAVRLAGRVVEEGRPDPGDLDLF